MSVDAILLHRALIVPEAPSTYRSGRPTTAQLACLLLTCLLCTCAFGSVSAQDAAPQNAAPQDAAPQETTPARLYEHVPKDTFNRIDLETEAGLEHFVEALDAFTNELGIAEIYPDSAALTSALEKSLVYGGDSARARLLVEYLDYISAEAVDTSNAPARAVVDELNTLIQFLDSSQLSRVYNQFGNLSSSEGDMAYALMHYRTAYERLEHAPPVDRLYVIGNIGSLTVDLGDTASAIKYLHASALASANIADAEERAYNRALDYGNLSEIYFYANKLDSAEFYTALCEAYSRQLQSTGRRTDDAVWYAVSGRVRLALHRGELDSAAVLLDSLQAMDSDHVRLRAQLLHLRGHTDDALDLLLQAQPVEESELIPLLRARIKYARLLHKHRLASQLGETLDSLQNGRANQLARGLVTVVDEQIQRNDRNRRADAQRYEERLTVMRARQRLWMALGIVLLSLGGAVYSYQRFRRSQRASQDLSELVTVKERELASANKELASRLASLERFNHILSHDLREPVRTIASFTTLLSRRLHKDGAQAPSELKFLGKGVGQLSDLLDSLEQLRALEHDEALGASVEASVCLTNAVAAASRRYPDASIELEHDELNASGVPVYGEQLDLALQVLLDNACTYFRPRSGKLNGVEGERAVSASSVSVRARCVAERLQVSISDQGIGIAAAYHDQIFEPFQRLNRREEFGGVGMGLALARLAIRKLGGELELSSSVPGEGSTFSITVPLATSLQGLSANAQ